jgi:hypothetical protein
MVERTSSNDVAAHPSRAEAYLQRPTALQANAPTPEPITDERKPKQARAAPGAASSMHCIQSCEVELLIRSAIAREQVKQLAFDLRLKCAALCGPTLGWWA